MNRGLATLLFFFLAGQIVQAQDSPPAFTLHGYLKNMQSFYRDPFADSTISSGLLHNRLNMKGEFGSGWYARLEIRTRIFYEEMVRLPGFAEAAATDNGYFDMTGLWMDQPELVAVSTIDRASVHYHGERVTVSAGRQRINWGVLTVWNPNDLFNAYNYLDFDYEERPGTDALRIQYATGRDASLEAVYAPAREASQAIAAALFKFNRWQYDLQVLAGSYRSSVVAGAGWAGNLGPAGFKGEVTFLGEGQEPDSTENNVAAAVMADYSFSNAWYVSAAALYIRNPMPAAGTSFQVIGDNTTITRLMPYPWSFFAGLSNAVNPLLTASFSAIYSPETMYTILIPSIRYNVLNNLDFDFAGQFFFAQVPGGYGSSGSALFLRFRWSF